MSDSKIGREHVTLVDEITGEELIVTSPNGGKKDDSGKLRFDFIVPEFLEAMAEILTPGGEKYGAYNWQGLDKERPLAALLRHLNSYRKGEFEDKDAPYGDNLAAVAVNSMFVWWLEKHERGEL